jgi:DivIVA domain-containing protein
MSITPQAIKDQEFQIKFRGYDAIEVKAYLELLAEEFFELHELRRKQEEEYAELYEETQILKQEKEALLRESTERDQRSEASVLEFLQKDETIADLQKKIENLEKMVDGSEQEKFIQQEAWERQETTLREEIERLNDQLKNTHAVDTAMNSEAEKLRAKVDLLESRITEISKEEVDFKVTLVAAQKFSEDVRRKAQEEATALLEQARDEVETFRREAEKELAKLPVEIDQLRQKKRRVHDDLKAVLDSYIEQIELVGSVSGAEGEDDFSELFQSITLSEDDEVDVADLDKLEVE